MTLKSYLDHFYDVLHLFLTQMLYFPFIVSVQNIAHSALCLTTIFHGKKENHTLLKIKVLHDAIEEPFLSKWFHKELLTSEEPFCFTKDYLWWKKRWFFKEPLTERLFVEPKMVLLWHRLKNSVEAPLFLRVYIFGMIWGWVNYD